MDVKHLLRVTPAAASQAIGLKVAEARKSAQVSPEVLVERMRSRGFPWHRQTLNLVERGERRLTVDELIGVADALADLGADVKVSKLLDEGGRAMSTADADEVVGRWAAANPKAALPDLEQPGAEQRMAEALSARLGRDVSVREVDRAAHGLWGCSLTERREALFAEGTETGSAGARRGHITRELTKDLLRALQKRRR
jgi:hypothetical protein